ncbi:MAG: C39 family peptidase [Acetobacteraceae bacterium]|nr:C39 family peptidase [Acetobacteraceae bacterium]
MFAPPLDVPYFSQWETPDLTLAVLAEGEAALRRDPRWAASGAASVEEYAAWAGHVCGMACLKMVLAARGQSVPTLDLARGCTKHGGYVVDPASGAIKGLIYAPFVRFVAEAFDLRAAVVTGIAAADLPGIMAEAAFFIASVHYGIRWPDRAPPSTGGHLVLVLAADADSVTFHNPSGHDTASQAHVALPAATFARFFAGRGIRIDL